jgi:hypothetical protein
MTNQDQPLHAAAADEQASRARFENAKRVLQESKAAAILQEINTALLKGRAFFDEYDAGVIMKWGHSATRRHVWVHIAGDEIWIRLRQHLPCQAGATAARCDGEYHAYTRAQWSDTPFLRGELRAYYDHPVAESSED